MQLIVDHLYLHAEHLPLVARTIYEEFWVERPGYSPAVFERLLADASSPDRIPLSLVALLDGRPAGTVNLIDNDDASRPHLHPWLAALVVLPQFRRTGVGTALVTRLLDEARRLGFSEVFLGTDAPAFYARLGATVLERASDSIVVMRCPTRRAATGATISEQC